MLHQFDLIVEQLVYLTPLKMAAPGESIAFCNIFNETNFLHVSHGHEDDCVIITNKGRSCNVYKVGYITIHMKLQI